MTADILGLGYVGLPLAIAFAKAGDHVVANDCDLRRVTRRTRARRTVFL